MGGLKVFAIVMLILCAIFSIRATLVVKYSDELSLVLKVLFLKIKILPKKKKKPKISDGKPKKVQKRLEKLEKQKEKKRQKALEKKKKKEAKKAAAKAQKAQGGAKPKKKKKSVSEILDIVKLITSALGDLFKSFGKHLKLKFARVHITVATGDAAKTATTYGAMCAAVTSLIEILRNLKGFSMDNEQISVNCDFLEEKSYADVHIEVGLRVWHVFAILFSAIKGAIRQYIKNMSNKSEDKAPTENKTTKTKPNNQLKTK